MFNREKFGKRLKELRTSKKATQSVVGELLGVTRTQICDLEKGNTTTSLENITILSEYYDVSADYLLLLSDDKR